MLYLKSEDGTHIVILESENLDELRKGRPARTIDGEVVIAWTPDPEWLSERILASGGDPAKIGKAVDEAAKRPQKPLRPYHRPEVKRL